MLADGDISTLKLPVFDKVIYGIMFGPLLVLFLYTSWVAGNYIAKTYFPPASETTFSYETWDLLDDSQRRSYQQMGDVLRDKVNEQAVEDRPDTVSHWAEAQARPCPHGSRPSTRPGNYNGHRVCLLERPS